MREKWISVCGTGFLVSGFVLFSALASCRHENVYLEEFDTVCFERQVLPALQTSCGIAGCHDPGTASEGYIFSDYASVMQCVNPGDPRGSLLYNIITDIHSENMMPPGQPLSREQRTLIHIWIAQGALNTQCESGIIPPPDTSTDGTPTDDTLCFVQDILPVLLSNCGIAGCHDATTHEEGYILISYSTLRQRSESIIPFDPQESKVYEVITETEEDDRMPPPPKQPLTTEQKDVIRKWIEEGAINSDCPQSTCDTAFPLSFTEKVNPVIQTNCVGCHNASQSTAGVNLNGYEQVRYYAETLRNNYPLLIGTIRKMPGFAPMPPSGSLSECAVRQIELWISQGKANN